MSDEMEIGEGLIPMENGWFLHKETGNRISPDGDVWDVHGELIWCASLQDEEDYGR